MEKLNEILKKAKKEGWAVGQFNISNLETLRAIVSAAKNLKSPVIIGTSEGESDFLGLKQAAALVKSFHEETGLPIFLNFDHGHSFKAVKEAIDAGYDTVHFDGSKLPLEENIKITKDVKKYAKNNKIPVEGEVGYISGASKILENAPEISEEDLTNPDDAARFIKETRIDRLAINIGTFHGMEASGINPHINIERLKEIIERAENMLLVLHGGSGTPDEDIKEAIRLGIVKININTELRVAYTNSLKQSLDQNSNETTPYKIFPKVIEEIQKIVENKIKLFGSETRV